VRRLNVTDENYQATPQSVTRHVLGIARIIVVVLSMFLGVSFFLPWLLMGKKDAIAFGVFCLAMVGVGAVVMAPKLLIDLAWEKRGKWLTVAQFVNGLCIIIAVPVSASSS
jgi:hypothetical protein